MQEDFLFTTASGFSTVLLQIMEKKESTRRNLKAQIKQINQSKRKIFPKIVLLVP
jgi:hypothetical protein